MRSRSTPPRSCSTSPTPPRGPCCRSLPPAATTTNAGRTLGAFRAVALITAAGIVVAALLGPPLLPLVFGEDFEPATLPFLILLPGALGFAASAIFSSGLAAANAPGLSSIGLIVSLIVGIALDLVLIAPLAPRAQRRRRPRHSSPAAPAAIYVRLTGSGWRALLPRRSDFAVVGGLVARLRRRPGPRGYLIRVASSSAGTAPRSPSACERTDAVRSASSRSPTTSMNRVFASSASRTLRPTDSSARRRGPDALFPEPRGEAARVVEVRVRDRQDHGLHRREPESGGHRSARSGSRRSAPSSRAGRGGSSPGGARRCPRPGSEVKPLGHLEVELAGPALPGSAERVGDVKVDLRPVERPLPGGSPRTRAPGARGPSRRPASARAHCSSLPTDLSGRVESSTRKSSKPKRSCSSSTASQIESTSFGTCSSVQKT